MENKNKSIMEKGYPVLEVGSYIWTLHIIKK